MRIALVAGGSGGIGGAVCRALAAGGRFVYVGHHRHAANAERVIAQIRESGGEAESIQIDVADVEAAERVCREIYEREEQLDILVNCAAINRESPAGAMDDETWREVLAANLDGAFRLSRTAAKYMMLGRWGRIIHLSSIAAIRGGRGQINYAVSKAGVEAMTRVLALELGRKGVLVNCVAPGVIETEMSKRIREEYGPELLNEIAVRRFGTPEDVAKVVAFLASDEAAYITGQVIRVDGGMAL